jgi:hypothetical protein
MPATQHRSSFDSISYGSGIISKPKDELFGIDIFRDLQEHDHPFAQLGHHRRSHRRPRRPSQLASSADRASIWTNLDCNDLFWIPHRLDMRTLPRHRSNHYHMVYGPILYHTGDVEA